MCDQSDKIEDRLNGQIRKISAFLRQMQTDGRKLQTAEPSSALKYQS